MRLALAWTLLAIACSEKVPIRPPARGSGGAPPRVAPAPLANGALFSASVGAAFDVQRAGDAERDLAVWNDGTVVVVDHPDSAVSPTTRLSIVTDFGRDTRLLLRADESAIVLDRAGRRAAVVASDGEVVETADLASGTTQEVARVAGGGDWARRRAPALGVDAFWLGASPDGHWRLWGYVGALVSHVYVDGPNGLTAIEMRIPSRVALRDDGVAMFFTEELDFSREHRVFLGQTYALGALAPGRLDEPPAPLSTTNADRLDVGAYTATPVAAGFAVGYVDGRVVVTDVEMTSARATFHAGTAVVAVATSPDERRLASAHADGTIYVWPLAP